MSIGDLMLSEQVQPPRGAESHTQWANVGAHLS